MPISLGAIINSGIGDADQAPVIVPYRIIRTVVGVPYSAVPPACGHSQKAKVLKARFLCSNRRASRLSGSLILQPPSSRDAQSDECRLGYVERVIRAVSDGVMDGKNWPIPKSARETAGSAVHRQKHGAAALGGSAVVLP